MGRKKALKEYTVGLDSAVSEAYSGMDELKEELQNWYDNLPENFQNGDKGSQLQDAIDQIDGVSEVEAPDAAEGLECTYYEDSGRSRSARRNTYVAMLNAAADAARQRIDDLGSLTFDDDGNRVKSETEEDLSLPDTEDEMDAQVQELETFADDCENAASEYESVEFPGMYG